VCNPGFDVGAKTGIKIRVLKLVRKMVRLISIIFSPIGFGRFNPIFPDFCFAKIRLSSFNSIFFGKNRFDPSPLNIFKVGRSRLKYFGTIGVNPAQHIFFGRVVPEFALSQSPRSQIPPTISFFSGFSLNPKKSEKKRFLFPWDLPVWALAAREWRVAAPWLKPFVSGVPDTNP